MLRRLLLVASLLLTACAADVADDEDTESTEEELSVPDAFGGRIAMARFYQHGGASVPESQQAAMILALAQTRPTYVSGLVRLDPDDAVQSKHLAAYAAVRAAMPNARTDIVLNAQHYRGPQGWPRLQKRFESINAAFVGAGLPIPDVMFFDFYSQGQMDVMERAAQWLHDKKRNQKIGGTFWQKKDAPKGTDFLVLDDHDGLREMIAQSRALRSVYGTRIPILAHIENNPGEEKTGTDGRNTGLEWMDGKLNRKDFIRKEAAAQRTGGFLVMYPVCFPLTRNLKAWDPTTEPGYLALVEKLMK